MTAQDVPQLVLEGDIDRASRSFDVVVADVVSIEYLSCPGSDAPCTSSQLHVRRSLRAFRYEVGTCLITAGGLVGSESGIHVNIPGSAIPNEGDLAVVFLWVWEGAEADIFYVVDGERGYRRSRSISERRRNSKEIKDLQRLIFLTHPSSQFWPADRPI